MALQSFNRSNSLEIKFNPPKELIFSKDVVIFILLEILPNSVRFQERKKPLKHCFYWLFLFSYSFLCGYEAISKVYHFPALIFILLFGLSLGNFDELRSFKFIQQFHPVNFDCKFHIFRELTTETDFLIRVLFFLLFGFLIKTSEILNTETIVWALAITVSVFVLRFIFLKIFKVKIQSIIIYCTERINYNTLIFQLTSWPKLCISK